MIHGWPLLLAGYLGVVGVTSALSAVMLVWDKRAAKRGRWRVRERTLHAVEMLGGWPGSWIVRRLIRHKTYKPSYRRVYAMIVSLHGVVMIAAMAAVVRRWWGG